MSCARVVLAATLLAIGLLAAPAGADRRADLEAVRSAIQASRERVGTYEKEQRGLLEAIEALDQAAASLRRELGHARRSAREARQKLETIRAEAAELAKRVTATEAAMKSRAVALYRAGELGSLRMLFTAEGLPEFLSRVSMLRRLLSLDADLLTRHRTESKALSAAEVRASVSARELTDAEQTVAARTVELESERGRKRTLVRRLHDDRSRERSALLELEKAARALEEMLQNLESELVADTRRLGPPFLSLRRRLDPPVKGPIVRSFGREVDEELKTETFHSGIVIDAPMGTPVAAVSAGRVRFAGWFRGYGRIVILDHADNWFTVSGHLDALDVALGDEVKARQTLGRVGETGSLTGPQLYFEIRRGAEAQNPADWLR